MIGITMVDKEGNFALALLFTQMAYQGRQRHGMVKHIRDERRAWRKRGQA